MIKNILASNTITLARALLALSTLLTLLFNDIHDLFPSFHIAKISTYDNPIFILNYFLWFNDITIPYFFSIIILVLTIMGFYPRIFSILQSWVAYSLFYSMLITEGGDQINAILTFLLIPICVLDNRKNGWIVIKEKLNGNIESKNNFLFFNALIVVFVIKVQMSILYFNAGAAKMNETEWINGTSVYYWFYDNMFGAPYWIENSLGFLFKNSYTVSLINWGVILLELFLFLGIFFRQRLKYMLFVLGFLLHFIIILIHGLPTFFLSMFAGLILYFFRLDITLSENMNELKKISIFKLNIYEKISRIIQIP